MIYFSQTLATLQQAIDHAQATGETLCIDRDVHHDGGLTIRGPVRITTDGPHRTLAVPNHSVPNIIVEPTRNGQTISIENINAFRGSAGWTFRGGYLSRLSRLDNLQASGCETGFSVQSGQIGCTHRKWVTENCTNGIEFIGDHCCNGLTLIGARVNGAVGVGINVHYPGNPGGGSMNGLQLLNPIIESNAGIGLRVHSAGVIVNGGWFESNGLDVEISSNYARGQATRAYLSLIEPEWNHARQVTRIRCQNGAFSLRVIGGSGRVGGANVIDGNNASAAANITLMDAGMRVTNWPESKLKEL